MEYVARQSGHLGSTIFLQIDPAIRGLPGMKFSPGVSNRAGVAPLPLQEAANSIDFEVLYTQTDWKDPEINRRLQLAGKCELLVPDHVPLRFIRNLPHG